MKVIEYVISEGEGTLIDQVQLKFSESNLAVAKSIQAVALRAGQTFLVGVRYITDTSEVKRATG